MPNDRITVAEPFGSGRTNRTLAHGQTGEQAYEDLKIHHPNTNANAVRRGNPALADRPAGFVDGEMEAINRTGDRNGIPLVSKDLILTDGPTNRDVMIPNPVGGYVEFSRGGPNTVSIWSGPQDDPNRELLGRVLHGRLDSSQYESGDFVPYGAPLIRQSNAATGGVHAHIELEPDQYRRYLGDMLNDRITFDRWPEQAAAQSPTGESIDPLTETTDARTAPVAAGASITDRDHPGNPLFQRVTALTEQATPPLTNEQRAYVTLTATSQGMTAENLATVVTRANSNGGLEVAFGTNVQGQRSDGWTQLPQTLPTVERTSQDVREEMQSRTQSPNQSAVQEAQRMSGP